MYRKSGFAHLMNEQMSDKDFEEKVARFAAKRLTKALAPDNLTEVTPTSSGAHEGQKEKTNNEI